MSDVTSRMIGRSVKRREDVRFLTVRGRYVADLALDHAAHVAVVRSPHAHARIVRIDGGAAHSRLGVFTLADLPELRGGLPPPVVPGVAVADALGAESPDLTDVRLRPHALARRA